MVIRGGSRSGAQAARRLAEASSARECSIEPGLTDAEFDRIEREFGFEFAADHRAFLAMGLPVSVPYEDQPDVLRTWREPWPDWRNGDRDALRSRLNWPVDGVLFDVENNEFWHDSWGSCPNDGCDALRLAREALAEVPVLVPVFGHRFLPAGSENWGHPVLSVWQTDIIYYGADLADWVRREFGLSDGDPVAVSRNPVATVGFWRDLL
jgi:hypothetical protein